MDRKLKVGSILLAVGLILFGISYIAAAVTQPSTFVTATIIVIFVVPGFVITLIGLTMTISALGPRKRGILSIGIGTPICAIVVLAILTRVAWVDIAVILSLLSLIFVSSLFIIPGIISLRYQRLSSHVYIACVVVAMTMMWTLIALMLVAINVPDFRTSFYDALLPLLGLGFFLGLLTTGLTYAYYETTSSKR